MKIFNSVVEFFPYPEIAHDDKILCVAEQTSWWLVYTICQLAQRLGSPQVTGSKSHVG